MTEHASADAMMAAAGLTGEFAEGTRPGLTAALASLAVESGLSDEGKGRAFAQFQDNLVRLAAIASDRAAYPEIASVKVDRPVFILGLPRCGTSILHALIGADPYMRTPLQWEVAAPSPPPVAAPMIESRSPMVCSLPCTGTSRASGRILASGADRVHAGVAAVTPACAAPPAPTASSSSTWTAASPRWTASTRSHA